MASFQKYKTKDGYKWLYKIYASVNPLTGKKKHTTKRGFKTKKEAQLDAAQMEQGLAEGTYLEDGRMTFEDVYQDWFKLQSSRLKPSSKHTVQSKFKNHILPNFGKLKVQDITKTYCQEVVNKVANELKSADYIKMYASQVFKYALKMDIISKNPMGYVVVPKNKTDYIADNEKRDYWEKHEIKAFLKILKEEALFRDYVMFHLLIYTGARKGEILALHESDIDFKNKTLSINKTLYREKGLFTFQTAKTASSNRIVSLDDATLNLLKRLIVETKERRFALGIQTKSDNLIFIHQNGNPIRLNYPNGKLDEITLKHKLHRITVHGLRHTHASLLFEAGASIKEVQERLGHADIKMTMNIYTHVTKSIKEQTAEKFQRFLES